MPHNAAADAMCSANWHPLQACTLIFARAIDFQGGAYGIGVLSKRKPLSCTMCPLPGREEERALLVVEFPEFFFACTHLSLTETDRMGALATIERMASGSGKPFFIAGDLNANPADGFMSAFGQSFNVLSDQTEHTFPATETGSDHRLHSGRTGGMHRGKNREQQVLPERLASDHRPIVVDILIR